MRLPVFQPTHLVRGKASFVPVKVGRQFGGPAPNQIQVMMLMSHVLEPAQIGLPVFVASVGDDGGREAVSVAHAFGASEEQLNLVVDDIRNKAEAAASCRIATIKYANGIALIGMQCPQEVGERTTEDHLGDGGLSIRIDETAEQERQLLERYRNRWAPSDETEEAAVDVGMFWCAM